MSAELSPPSTPTESKMAQYTKSSSFSLIRAAVVDERTQNVRYRQRQLLSLHSALRENYLELTRAILDDTNYTAAEADVEICLAMRCVKDVYTELNFEQSLELEYTVVKGQDFKNRRVGVGLVYIQPQLDSLLYSVIAPISAAIGAGNCIVLKLQNESATPSTITRVLGQALDSDTFHIVDQIPSADELSPNFVQVIQDTSDTIQTSHENTILSSPSTAMTVAVVDRTADIEQAARSIVTARFSFDGKSPYAPDLVLVNEFIKKKFTSEVLRCTSEHFGDRQEGSKSGGDDNSKKILDVAKEDAGTTSIVSSSRSTILSVEKRSSPFLTTKINSCILPIHAVRSLDDAIQVLGDNDETKTYLAAYFFAAPTHAKYLSQFTKSRVSYINHIPSEILVGPAAPIYHTPSSSLNTNPYSSSMFEIPSPQIITQSPESQHLESILREESRTSLAQLKEQELKELAAFKERKVGRVDFFIQGLFTSLGLMATPVVVAVGVAGYLGVKAVLERRR